MMKWVLSLGAGYVVTNIAATTLAVVILQPMISPMFGSYI